MFLLNRAHLLHWQAYINQNNFSSRDTVIYLMSVNAAWGSFFFSRIVFYFQVILRSLQYKKTHSYIYYKYVELK